MRALSLSRVTHEHDVKKNTQKPSLTKFIIRYTAPTTNSDDKNEVNGNQHQQIVLIANEQLEPSDSETTNGKAEDAEHRKISNGGDEELQPLHWLHDKNLLKGEHTRLHHNSLENSSQFRLGINLSCPKVQSPTSEVNQQTTTTTRNGAARTSSNDDSGTSDDNCASMNNDKPPHLHQQPQSIVSLNHTADSHTCYTFQTSTQQTSFLHLSYPTDHESTIAEAIKLHDKRQQH